MPSYPQHVIEHAEEVKLRGVYLNMAVDAEFIISMTIVECCKYDKAEISSYFSDNKGKPSDLDALTMFEKIEVCKQSLLKHYPDFYTKHLVDIEKIDQLRGMRNKFAHQKMDFDKQDPNIVQLTELASDYRTKTVLYSVPGLWKELLEYRESVSNVLTIIGSFIGYAPPSISPTP